MQLDSPAAMASLQVAVRDALTPATAARLQEGEDEYYYDSDDSVPDIDEQYPELAERVVQWQAAQWDAASVPSWYQPDSGQEQRLFSNKLPDLCETINQVRGAKPWPSDILPRSRWSSANEPRRLPNQIPMMPSMEDAPKQQNGRVGIGGIQESGAKIGRRNSTRLGSAARVGSVARVGSTAKVGSTVRVGSAVRAGRGPRAMAAMRPRHAAGTRCGGLESGHPNVAGRIPAHPLAAPRNRVGGMPSSRRPAAKCRISLN